MSAMSEPHRRPARDPEAHVLVVGRSPSVLEGAVGLLRERGLRADATNAFDRVLQDYDGADLDVVVFGGLVPPATKEHLRAEISRLNPSARFVQGLVGISGVIAAQVDALLSGPPPGRVGYDETARSIVLDLDAPAHVVVDAFWVTSLTPPEPTSTQARIVAADLAPGAHRFPLPGGLPDEGVFASVRVDDRVTVLTVAPMPAGIAAAAATLPAVRSVTTRPADSRAEVRS